MVDSQIISAVIAAVAVIGAAIITSYSTKQAKKLSVVKEMLYKRYCDIQYLLKTRDELLDMLSKTTGTPQMTLLRDVNKKMISRNLKISPSTQPGFVDKVVMNQLNGIEDFLREQLINTK